MATVYILSFVIEPGKKRNAAFAWFNSEHLFMVDGLEISGSQGSIVLKRKGINWYSAGQTGELPVKQDMVRDLFVLLSKKEPYSLRASSAEGIEKLKLTEDSASRIIVRGGAGLPLLDLLIGIPDALGREVFLRRAGWNQIYSALDRYSYFTEARPSSWYNLRLFQQPAEVGLSSNSGEGGLLTMDKVQQVDITLPDSETFILRRSGNGWIMPGNEASLDYIRVESWLRLTLEAEADDFGEAPGLAEGTIILRFGDGSVRTLQAGPKGEEGKRNASISGQNYFYILSERTFNYLFREKSYFIDGSP
jgi:hypothetical protein